MLVPGDRWQRPASHSAVTVTSCPAAALAGAGPGGMLTSSASRHKARQAKLAMEGMPWPGPIGTSGMEVMRSTCHPSYLLAPEIVAVALLLRPPRRDQRERESEGNSEGTPELHAVTSLLSDRLLLRAPRLPAANHTAAAEATSTNDATPTTVLPT